MTGGAIFTGDIGKVIQEGAFKDNDVSYTILNIDTSKLDETIRKMRGLLNVQTIQDEYPIPFLPFAQFQHLKDTKDAFIHGRSGAGKSRVMLEVAESFISSSKRLVVINPIKTSVSEVLRKDLYELAKTLTNDDLLIWDNFPLDLIRRDQNAAKESLQVLTSNQANQIVIALSPKYPESYVKIASSIPEVKTFEIHYSKEQLRSILEKYGEQIPAFKGVFDTYAKERNQEIAEILWSKEPTPLVVLAYYKQLLKIKKELASGLLNVIDETRKLSNLTGFYSQQLKFLQDSGDSSRHLIFLYVLKLLYELGLVRNLGTISNFQRNVFRIEIPNEPISELGSWIYVQELQYSMHDSAQESISLNDDIMLKVIDFLQSNPQVIGNDANTLYLFGLFLGKNSRFFKLEGTDPLLPPRLDEFIAVGEEKRRELKAFFEELPPMTIESFKLDEKQIKKLLTLINKRKDHFGKGFGQGLAHSFFLLSEKQRNDLWQKMLVIFQKTMEVAHRFGGGAASYFISANKDIRDQVWEKLEWLAIKDEQFATGFGDRMGELFPLLPQDVLEEVIALANRNHEVAASIGINFSTHIRTKDKTLQDKILAYARRSRVVSISLGIMLGESFSDLDANLQKKIIMEAKKNPSLARGLSTGSRI
jgi:hypothetical protein